MLASTDESRGPPHQEIAISAQYPDLKGKAVVVTGANGGMGSAIALALSQAGALVVAGDVQDAPSTALSELAGTTYQRLDVCSEGSVAALIATAVAAHGRLDCAVNTAAIEFETVPMAECETEDFDRLMTVNLRGLFLCIKHQLRAMLAGDTAGSIVNLASTTSFQPGNIQPAYTASKHGVVGLTRQAAVDYAGHGIRVNAVAPGNIQTPMLERALERRSIDAKRAQRGMPLGRFGRPEEISEAALWLCSEASSFTTGHVLGVEGGMLLL